MSLSTQPVKGARDFYPEDMRLQKYIFGVWRSVCEKYGYEEYDAPILEPTDLYLSKGSQEIINEQTYTFKDRGDRSVTLRTEMTPTVSRMIAGKRQELAYPARWYSIPQCWRYERMQRGRGREFYQLNVDMFGESGIACDFELIQIADAIMQSFGAKKDMYSIRLNSRKLMDKLLLEILGYEPAQAQNIARLIDRKNKLELSVFREQLDSLTSSAQRENGTADKLVEFLSIDDFNKLPEGIKSDESAVKLAQLTTMLKNSGITNVEFDPTLMRGFDYYTEIAFEVFDTDPDNNRAMFGGGRYDGLVELFGAESLPSNGFAMGDITLKNFLTTHGLLPALRPETDLYVVLLNDNLYEQCTDMVQELREQGLNVAVDTTGRKTDKQIKSADKKGIRYVVFLGDSELADKTYTFKDLKTGSEDKYDLTALVSLVKGLRDVN